MLPTPRPNTVRRGVIPAAALILFGSCTSAPDRPTETAQGGGADRHSDGEATTGAPSTPAIDAACRALVRAAPADWPERAAAVTGHGPAAAPALAAAIRREPAADGEQIAIAVLGALGGDAAEELLMELVDAPDARSAAEAALAIGRMPSPTAGERTRRLSWLRRVVGEPSYDPSIRTGAAASALRLGDRDVAVDFLHLIWIADSPAARETRERLGLPNRSRWAHERVMARDAIADTFGHDFGLDPDLAWPDLAARADRFRTAATTEQR